MGTSDNMNVATKFTLDLSLWLDDYDDIYSDFDSRNYLKRRISSDFIEELQISMKNRKQKINDLVLLLPEAKRDNDTEHKITHNLKNYFTLQLNLYAEKYSKNLRKGIVLFITAILLMTLNSVISFQLHNNLLSSIIRVILEPSGWFLIWVAFDILYYDLREIRKEKYLFQELSAIKIYFQSSDLYIGME